MTTRVTTPDILGNALSPEQAERAEVAQTLRYDYSQLGEQAGAIRNHAIEIKRNERRANEAIVEAGQHLIAVKESLKHGQWEDWLQTEFHMSNDVALRMMNIARRFGPNPATLRDFTTESVAKTEIISVLSPTVLGMLASPSVPEEAVKAVVDAAGDGKVSVAQAKQIIAERKPARLFVSDLKGLVAKWMGMNWQYAWPDNPSHTNGEFWQKLTAWMHENIRETWQEGDLKEAIKAVHYQSREGALAPTPTANQLVAASPDFASVLVLEGIVRRVWDTLNPTIDAATDKKLAQAALRDAINKAGQFWNQCKAAMDDDIRAYHHADLQQAIKNVCAEKERTVRQAQPWTPPGTGARQYATPLQEPFVPTPNKPEPGVWVPPTLAEFNARPRVTSALDLQPTVDMCWNLQYGKAADPATLYANIKQARGEAERQGHFFNFCHDSADDELRPFTDNTLNLAIQIYCDKLSALLLQSNPELFPAMPVTDYDEEEEETIARPDFGIAEPDEDQVAAPVPELVEPVPELAEGMSGLLLRQQQIKDVRDRLIDAITTVKQAGELTGKHTVTLGADRELRRVIQLLDNELDAILKGATHEYA